MDFGSSHVFAGSSDDKTYYSSVPKEITSTTQHGTQNEVQDPIYESIDRKAQSWQNKELPQLPEEALAPPTKPKVPEKPAIYRTQSLSDKLRKALEVREKELESNSKLQPVFHEYDAVEMGENKSGSGPPLPPRTTLPHVPSSPTSQAKKTVSKKEPIYVPHTANKGAPTASIPMLRPPPSSIKRKTPQPDVNFANFTQPVAGGDLKQTVTTKQTSNVPEEVAWDAMPTANTHKVAVPNPYHEFQQTSLERLYPMLPSADEDSNSHLAQPSIVPSAPQLSHTLVRRDAEFLKDQLRSSALVVNGSGSNSDSVDTNLQPDGESGLLQVLPTAPRLTASMIRRDQQRASPSPLHRTNSMESVYSSADTNVVCIKLGIIGEKNGSQMCYAPPVQCATCTASNVNASEEWICKFCGSKNFSPCPQIPERFASDVTYVLQPPMQTLGNNDSLVVLCIDTSGSMCVTSKVESPSGNLFVSRLQGVQQAIHEQLNRISTSNPGARVALVTFSDVVQMLGDGSPSQHLKLDDMQLFDFDYLHYVGSTAPLPSPISKSKGQLDNAVSNLKEGGVTALGPALLLSTALASQKPGSQVIVCTDGRANVGVGSLETESDYELCHHFYKQTTEMASMSGVIVSILSIAGTDCRLVELGKVAQKTSGKVSIVEANNISEEFHDILSDTVLATNVSIDLVTHKQLYFSSTEGVVGSNVGNFVGNITNDSETSFRYGIKRDGEFANVTPPQEAPFQLKIMYRPPDGSVCLRVITQMRPVTENRELAESEMNLGVVGAYASQSAAKLALEGEIDYAREVTNAHKQLLFRGMSLRSQTSSIATLKEEEKIYESVKSKIDDIGRELAKVDVSSSSEDLSSPDIIPCEVDVYEGVGGVPTLPRGADVPPALPPRGRSMQQPNKLSKAPSLESMLSKLPSIPKGPIGKKKKNKKKVAQQYKDETAQKMFSFSKATSSRMVGS
uniref:Uncharacterized protein LOC100181368 n=1 Tax=Phallusia mammillata TaxID=59560 RepID=A0A6F9DHZ2_9ASCI|nr:uncharacterized protein LOC100181368 [Phallusia mammillata]